MKLRGFMEPESE